MPTWRPRLRNSARRLGFSFVMLALFATFPADIADN